MPDYSKTNLSKGEQKYLNTIDTVIKKVPVVGQTAGAIYGAMTNWAFGRQEKERQELIQKNKDDAKVNGWNPDYINPLIDAWYDDTTGIRETNPEVGIVLKIATGPSQAGAAYSAQIKKGGIGQGIASAQNQNNNMSLVGDLTNFLASDTGQAVTKSAFQLGQNLLNKQGNGINYANPAVTPSGNIFVPGAQSGNGLFSSVPNVFGGSVAGQYVDKVVTNVAGALSGNPIIATGGGVAITGSPSVGLPVTQNTSYTPTGYDTSWGDVNGQFRANGSNVGPTWLIYTIIGLAIASFLGIINIGKLFNKRK